MLGQVGRRFEAWFRQITPDPFVLSVLLTLVVFALAFFVEGQTPADIVAAWQADDGFFGLLAFTMQMILILVTGHALAATRPVRRAIERLARLPPSGPAAAALVAFVSIGCALLNWGLGLIVGALLAREVGRSAAARGVAAHYPLLVACGYSGLMCWHGGLSGTAPLKMTTAADVSRFLGDDLAASVAPIPFTHTVLGGENLLITGGLWVIIPLLAYAMAPRRDVTPCPPAVCERPEPAAAPDPGPRSRTGALLFFGVLAVLLVYALIGLATPALAAGLASALGHLGLSETTIQLFAASCLALGAAWMAGPGGAAASATRIERFEQSPWLMAAIAAPLAFAVLRWFREVGIEALEPNAMNLIFLTAGLLLAGSLGAYARSIGEATRGASGIVLQFPFYAGIMGVMRHSGLARDLAAFLGSHAPASLYNVTTFLSAGAVNLFVPSGGGQWAVQGPIAMDAANRLGLDHASVVMAVAYGDQWTNMLQPFWALPLLAITKIEARDIMGYTMLFLLVGGVWMAGGLFLFAL